MTAELRSKSIVLGDGLDGGGFEYVLLEDALEAVAKERAKAAKDLAQWLADPKWPQFGPGIGPGPLDPGRMAARAALQQAMDVLEETS